MPVKTLKFVEFYFDESGDLRFGKVDMPKLFAHRKEATARINIAKVFRIVQISAPLKILNAPAIAAINHIAERI